MTVLAERPAATPDGPPTAVTNEETGSRVYIHPRTGERFVSVTTVLGLIAKESLPYWAAMKTQEYAFAQLPLLVQSMRRRPCEQKGDDRCGLCRDCVALEVRRAPDRLRDEAADRGKRIHAIAERHTLTGEIDPHGADVAPYVRQYMAWRKQFQPTFDAAEMTVINREYGYAGTLDAILRLGWCPPKYKDLIGTPQVTDLKTGKGVYAEYAMQLAAYRHSPTVLLPNGDELPLPEVSGTGLLLHVRDDNYWVRPVKIGRPTFDAFLRVLDFYRWHEDMAGDVIERAMYKPPIKDAVPARVANADQFNLARDPEPAITF